MAADQLPAVLVYSPTAPVTSVSASVNTAQKASPQWTIPANSLAAGDVITVDIWGFYGTGVSTTSLQLDFLAGTTTLGTSGAVSGFGNNTSAKPWRMRCTLLVVATGISGSVDFQGVADFYGPGDPGHLLLSKASRVALDTTVDQTLAVQVTWGTAQAGSDIDFHQFNVYAF